MAQIEELKQLIADTLKIDVHEVEDSCSLKAGKLKTSAGSVILGNIVKKVYGLKIDCKKIQTFGELVNAVNGISGDDESIVERSTDDSDQSKKRADSETTEIRNSGSLVCGVDIQEIDVFPEVEDYWIEDFYTDNFTKDEIAYCVTAASPRHSFAARWCVKEALHKCGAQYYDLPPVCIQVTKQKSGAVIIEIRKNNKWEVLPFACSISHADCYAVGMVTGFEVI